MSPQDPPVEASHRLPDEARVFIAAIAFRVVTALVGFLANLLFPAYQDQGYTVFRERHPLWDAFARFDSGWYHGIAANGYEFVEGGRNNLAFFPLYPMLMRLGGRALGGRQEEYYFAGIVVSWVSFGFAMMLLYRLARLHVGRDEALRSAVYAAVFPFAFFFGMVYSESLFLLCLVGAAYCLATRRWVLGALAGAAMTATRVTGIMAVPGLALIAWQAAGPGRAARVRALAAAAGCAGGFLAYSAFNYYASGNPFAWYESITRWSYQPGGNPAGALYGIAVELTTRPYEFLTTERMAPYDTLNTAAALVTLGLTPLIATRLGAGYALIVIATLLVPLSSGQFEGLGRYCSVMFPVPILLASYAGRVRHQALVTASTMLYTLGLSLFVNVHPLF
ncbi:MAG: mannosyltransferase family protein [Acidobacteriota bacterium]